MKKVLTPALVFFLSVLAAGCSEAASQCQEWRDDGAIFSTIDSCTACYERFGPHQLDAITGCALGLDAAQLVDSSARPGLR